MTDPTPLQAAALLAVQTTFVLAVAPLLLGVTKQVKARLQYRRGPSIWQPYRDLRKWWRKSAVESDDASFLTRWVPVAVIASIVAASALLPLVSVWAPLPGAGDLLVVIGLLALARFLLALGALDSGSAFGGMGASRDVAIACLVEPGLVLALAVAVAAAGSTDVGAISREAIASGPAWLTPPLLLAAAAFALVAIAETGHEPVDNPDTHLELTMIHEGMLLEASGRRLALLMAASEVRLIVVVGLFAAAFVPFGAATDLSAAGIAIGVIFALAKLLAAAVLLGLLDATLPKLRILALPGLLGVASVLGLTAIATRLWIGA
jgi:formate hydrogenlyase subunit 4